MTWRRYPWLSVRRHLSSQNYKELLGLVQPKPLERVVHVERDYVADGQVVRGKGAVAEVLGHDLKEAVAEPDPKTDRWRMSFLRVGAFRKRSVRVEVRKREFGPDEILSTSTPLLEVPGPGSSLSNQPETHLEGVPMDEFMDYVDRRLAEMEPEDVKAESSTNFEVDEVESDSLVEETAPVPLPVEFRSCPFQMESEDKTEVPRRGPLKWKPAGRSRTRPLPQSRAAWMQEWSSKWPSGIQKQRLRSVPSSIRNFYNNPKYSYLPHQALCYLEDSAPPRELKFGRHSRISSILVDFLKSQPAFRGRTAVPSGERHSFWIERKQGKALWSFLSALSDDIRHGRFRFEWEKHRCTEARLYKPLRRRSKRHSPSKTGHLELFGDLLPTKLRFPSLMRDATFREKSKPDYAPAEEADT